MIHNFLVKFYGNIYFLIKKRGRGFMTWKFFKKNRVFNIGGIHFFQS
jgi:hypothetical protein